MECTVFAVDRKTRREFAWDCRLDEDINTFVTEKLGHRQWTIVETLHKFSVGEAVFVEDAVGEVVGVNRTPFLLNGREMSASHRSPVYKVRIGEGTAYVSHQHLRIKLPVKEALKEAVKEHDLGALMEFFDKLVESVPEVDRDMLQESTGGLKEKLDHLDNDECTKKLYEGLMEILDEDQVVRSLSEVNCRNRTRVIRRMVECGIVLPGCSVKSATQGLSDYEASLVEAYELKDVSKWIREGVSVETACQLSSFISPDDYALTTVAKTASEIHG